MNKFFFVLASLILFVIFSSDLFIFAQEYVTPISRSTTMNDIIFDGKWSFVQEWKQSALIQIATDSGPLFIRTAHQDDYVYVMLDVLLDLTPSNDDYALVCFDSRINDSSKNNDSSYCFKINVNDNKPETLLWSEEKNIFEITKNHAQLVSVGGISDENDRYSRIPHTSFEFKIPIELLNRYDKYGYFVGVYNSNNTESHTWPPEMNIDLNSELPSPQNWGLLFSPDKSLPEYDLPILILIFTISFVILFSTKKSSLKILVDSK